MEETNKDPKKKKTETHMKMCDSEHEQQQKPLRKLLASFISITTQHPRIIFTGFYRNFVWKNALVALSVGNAHLWNKTKNYELF